jgi:hypothetical protein
VDTLLRCYAGPDPRRRHQFLVIFKPELTEAGALALRRSVEVLTGHGVRIGAVRVKSSRQLVEEGFVGTQWPQLNRVSRLGVPALRADARASLALHHPRVPMSRVLGGHELLERYPSDLTPFALDLLCRNLAVTKLGTGSYSIEARLDGHRHVLLNAFHPQQEQHFCTPGRAIVLLEASIDRSVPETRRTVVGATDPRDAVVGSLKRVLLDEQQALGLRGISTARNAVHMSPSALEGMAGMRRYFDVEPADTAFGSLLNLDPAALASLAEDEVLFEVTEDLDLDAAAAKCRERR